MQTIKDTEIHTFAGTCLILALKRLQLTVATFGLPFHDKIFTFRVVLLPYSESFV